MRGDVRSRRVAVVPDALVNPPPGGVDHAAALAAAGWGLVVLPPAESLGAARGAWLEAIVDEVITFLGDDYEVALAGVGDAAVAEFSQALRAAGHEVTRKLDLGLPTGPSM
jgi:hypothetical protein